MNTIKRDLILKILKDKSLTKELSTGRIASLVSVNQYRAEKLLNELEKEKKIIRIEKGIGVYWKII